MFESVSLDGLLVTAQTSPQPPHRAPPGTFRTRGVAAGVLQEHCCMYPLVNKNGEVQESDMDALTHMAQVRMSEDSKVDIFAQSALR